jgi:heme oxygenase
MTDLDAIKTATWHLHKRAEQSGIIADILSGQATRVGVALLLRNLLPVYQILDASPFGHPALARSRAIKADLETLALDRELPLLDEGAAYAERVRDLAEADTEILVAHAYVRYLGDLKGGQIIQRRLSICLGNIAGTLLFHQYPDLQDHEAFARDYRSALDQAVRAADVTAVAQETAVAFDMNILLADAVKAHVNARSG